MHIPEGFLGPITWSFFWLVMIPIWVIASRKVKKTLKTRHVPLLAIGAAFTFVIMMFNVPIPGGGTGHAVGGTLLAIVLGPWAALIAVSVAVVIQALLFGDGGITAIATNCFNMAFVLPFTGYYIYRIISAGAEITSKRRWVGAGIGGYVGLSAAAILTGIEFGIQPILHHTASGQALYFPYPLSIAVTAMAIGHLFFFGFVEFIATALVVRYIQQTDLSLLEITAREKSAVNVKT
jgi:cobalt/nickel transport system permease protein